MARVADVRMAAGAGNQRLYLIPDHDLIIVRQASGVLRALTGDALVDGGADQDTLALTETALWSPRTSSLSRREEARPPRTDAATLSGTESGSSMPGTAQLTSTWAFETRSWVVSLSGADRVGTGAWAGLFTGPLAIGPKYLSVSSRALAGVMSDRVRLPLVPLSPAGEAHLRQAMSQANLAPARPAA